MKKLNYLLLGLAGLTMASCSQDDLLNGGADGNYAIQVSLPSDVATRASIGDDATAAQNLYYAVYDMDGNFVQQGDANFNGATTLTLPLELASGASFQIAFFAQSPESVKQEVYKFDATAKTITVNYGNMESAENNADDYDCFYKLFNTGVIGSASMETKAVLSRPVAQINWGTSDFAAPSVVNSFSDNLADLKATLKVTVPNIFNMLDQTTTGEDEVAIGEFTPNNGTDADTYPVGGYEYVAMQYVLVPAEKTIQTLTLDVTNTTGSANNTITVDNAPLQANYRTNIYGNLLTDNINFTVELSDKWGAPDYNLPQPWDGETMTEPTKDSDGAYIVYTPAEWVWLTKKGTQSNGNVKINANLDFGGNTITPYEFTGNIDGQGYTISNVDFGLSGGYATGLIDNQSVNGNINVKNLTITNVSAVNHSGTWGYTGAVIGAVQRGATITLDNVTVIDANLDGIQSVGGLIGFLASGCTANITNCSVQDSYLTNMPMAGESGFVAGMVGRQVGTAVFGEGNSVKNTTIKAFWTTKRGINSIQEVVGVEGGGTNSTASNVQTSNVTIEKTEVITGASVNGTSYTSLDAAVAANPNGATIQLGVGNYSTPNNFGTGDYVLKGFGADYTIVEANNPTWNGPGTITASDLTFKSFVNSTNHTHMAFTGASEQNFTNVTFNGEFHVTSGNATFTNCTFNYDKASGTNYQLWCETSGTVNVTNCTMNCNNGKAILVYGESAGATGGDVNVDGLTVTSTGNPNDKGVVEIHSENYIEAQTIKIANVTYPASYFKGGLWREINNNEKSPNYENPTHYYTIYVNGEEVEAGGQTGPQPTNN